MNSQVLEIAPTVQRHVVSKVRLTGDSDSGDSGVNMSVNGCLTLCVSPVTGW